MNIGLEKIEFLDLIENNALVTQLNLLSSFGDLNMLVNVDKVNKKINLIVADPTSLAKITLPVGYVTWNKDDPSEEHTFYVEYSKFFYSISQYPEEEHENIILQISFEGDKSEFVIFHKTDRIMLPSMHVPNSIFVEKNKLLLNSDFESAPYVFSFNKDKDAILALHSVVKSSLFFLPKDETKNNAGSIYNDKFIVNDPRHVFIQNVALSENIPGSIPLHKKNMRLFNSSCLTSNDYSLTMLKSTDKIKIEKPNFIGVFSNSMSNVSPPSNEDLDQIRSSTLIMRNSAKTILDTIKFFSGYYTSSSDFKSLGIETIPEKNEVRFFLRDLGVAGFGACSIERTLSSNTESEVPEVSIITIFDSIKDFLVTEDPNNIIEVYFDNESQALYLKGNSEIYISRLG